MIKVTVFQDDTGRILGFEVRGHAGFEQAGRDIVCAGVSAITITACNGLEHFLGAEALQVEAPEPGEMRCFIRDTLDKEKSQIAQIILQTMLIGLNDVQSSYRQFVKIEKRRCIPC